MNTTADMVFIPLHIAEVVADLLTIDALDLASKVLDFKAYALQVFPARYKELPNSDIMLER